MVGSLFISTIYYYSLGIHWDSRMSTPSVAFNINQYGPLIVVGSDNVNKTGTGFSTKTNPVVGKVINLYGLL